MLLVTQAAGDRKLLTTEQMRLAAGLAADDASQDSALALLNARISAEIVEACRIAIGNGAEPTLRREALLERFRLGRDERGPLILARRHNVEILSVVIDGVALTPDDWLVDSESGLLARLRSGVECEWTGTTGLVAYRAGFEDVPPDLVGTASDLVRLRRSEVSRDPLAKRERVDVDGIDAIETEYWISVVGSSASTGPVPPELLQRLSRYVNRTRS